MKKIILILTITIFSKNINAQIGVPDTLTYLNSIVANKNIYVGQPFSVLYNVLSIQVKFFQPFAAIHYDKNKETSTSFSFYFPLTIDDMYLAYPKLEIYWQSNLNINQSGLLYSQNNGGGWDTTVYNFYKNAIIADIKVKE